MFIIGYYTNEYESKTVFISHTSSAFDFFEKIESFVLGDERE